MGNKNETIKSGIFEPDKTKELQRDWQEFGKANVYYGLVVVFIFAVSMFYHICIK